MSTVDTSLAGRLHGLPLELFDIIKELVLLQESSLGAITIDGNWRPPASLRVNSASRHAAAQVYYSLSVFDFSHMPTEDGGVLCKMWYDIVPPEHRDQIRHIRFTGRRENPTHPIDFSGLWQYMLDNDSTNDHTLHRSHLCTLSDDGWREIHHRHRRVWDIGLRSGTDYLLWLRERAEMPLQWYGGNGVVHDLVVPNCRYDAGLVLIADLRREVEKVKAGVEEVDSTAQV